MAHHRHERQDARLRAPLLACQQGRTATAVAHLGALEAEGPDPGREGTETRAIPLGLACHTPLIGLRPDRRGQLGFESLMQQRCHHAL